MAAPTRRMYIGVTVAILLFIPAGVVINYWGPAIRDAWRCRKIGRPLEQKGKVVGYLWAGGTSYVSRELDLAGKVTRESPPAGQCFQMERLANGNTLKAAGQKERLEEITPDGEVVWKTPPSMRVTCLVDVSRLSNGNTLVVYEGVAELDSEGKTVWSHACSEPYSAQRLANGNTLIGTRASVMEITSEGRIVWEKSGFDYLFHARRLANGNTLLATGTGGKVVELDRAEDEVWSHKTRGFAISAERLPDGNTLIVTQGPNDLILVSPDGKEKTLGAGSDGKARPIYSGR